MEKIELLKAMNTIIQNMDAYEDEDSGLYDYWAQEAIPDEAGEYDYKYIADDKELFDHVVRVFIYCTSDLIKDGIQGIKLQKRKDTK